MKTNYVTGDATQPQGNGLKVITHICNDIGGWGRGFVLALSKRWKQPEKEYRQWYESGQNFQLGEVQFVQVEADVVIANIIGQHKVSATNGVPPIRYEAVRKGLQKVSQYALDHQASVHMPRMGAGLAGGQWEEIEKIVEEELTQKGIVVTVYDLA
ncbi:MAG: Appr-1-p processing protein [Bacteroidota bacterium]